MFENFKNLFGSQKETKEELFTNEAKDLGINPDDFDEDSFLLAAKSDSKFQELKMLIFAPATLCQILARKYKELGIRKKIYLNTIEAAPLITDSNIEYCHLMTLQDCKDFVVQKKIELAVVLTIALTNEGLVNFFKYNLNLPVIGNSKAPSFLAKNLCKNTI